MSSTEYRNAVAWISSVGARDYNSMAEYMHKDFTHRFFPASLGGLGKPVRSKQEFINRVKGLMSNFERLNFLPPTDTVESKEVVVLHFTSDGIMIGGKPYQTEYVFIIRFEDDKIVSVKEFVDSKYVLDMIGGEPEAA